MRPIAIAALRMQANFASIDSSTGSTTPSFALTDAYVQLSPPESSVIYHRYSPALIVGQFKTPFSLEYMTAASALLTANRSQVVDSLATHRDIGVMGQVQAWDRIVLAAALTNGAGANHPTNPTGHELATGRLTLLPFGQTLAVAGKWLAQGGDHRWGADVRWFSDPHLVPGSIVAEGEWIRRAGSVTGGTDTEGSGGYALALWRALPWLEPVLKWEQLRETHTSATLTSRRTATWTTYGAVLRSPEAAEHLRIQINWIEKAERPVAARNELLTQLIIQF
jgi:hypothetical protein